MTALLAVIVLYGTAVSPGRPVTGRLTFDSAVARQGGAVYAVPRLEGGDEQALRMSEALILTGTGGQSRAAQEARRRRLPAVALGSARWEPGGKLLVEHAVLGPAKNGLRQVVSRERVELVEGSVVTVDPGKGTVTVIPKEKAADWLAAAEAARAYDSLRSADSLGIWLSGQESPAVRQRLDIEMLRRAADGDAELKDYLRLRSMIMGKALSEDERSVLADAGARLSSFLAESSERIGEAGNAEAVLRIREEAQRRYDAYDRVSSSLGHKIGPAGSLIAGLQRAAKERLSSVPAKAGDWSEAAVKAGAESRARKILDASFYKKFVEENGLARQLEDISGDASLTLGRKSQRLRALILSKKAPDLDRALPPGERLRLLGEGERFEDVPRAQAGAKVLEIWAAAWDPGPLGARKRVGGLHPQPSVTAEAGGGGQALRAWTRDPLSSRRQLVQGVAFEVSLDRGSGEPALPPSGSLPPAAALRKISKVLRVLEGHWGRPVLAELTLDGERLSVLSAVPDSGSR
jgi:hypothetical protein